ncbi:hypothetical protein BDP27DRAFT_1407256 [Rhodocollybia butyracea]|uniref:Uncharacterized protein n=1 Tax=Rhodocollybia butyracea TaxID=206335 RepID=A0A9P5PAX6_9AGAR|nr:hypothetical protein BDP27DRAFT_1407256 [Rhodocollybia butyracea]
MPCQNQSQIIQWSGGIRYMNGIYHHNHWMLPVIHLTPKEKNRFETLVGTNPKSAPAAIVSGNTVDGTSGPDISSALIHSGRVGRYRSAILGKAESKSGDDFIASFMQYQKDNPNWIIAETMLGGVSVVSGQTPFMASQLHDEALQIDGPFNGIVSDAAHGWWRAWVPVLISYSNGASEQHFEHHFLALLESIASIALQNGKEVIDELFASVCIIFKVKFYELIITIS